MKRIQSEARDKISAGALTGSYGVDPEKAIALLNDALATEIVCNLRYRQHYFLAEGMFAPGVAQEFKEHAREEEEHADRIAARIRQIGGIPEFNPDTLTARSHAEFVRGDTLVEMIEEDLIAERVAIDTYRKMIEFFGEGDSTSRRLLEDILEKEEEHADDMAGLLMAIDPSRRIVPEAV